MHPILELAAVLHPMPKPGNVVPEDCYGDACEQTARERKQYADNLEAVALGTEDDPLVLALREAGAEREAADQVIRRLLAYAREFHPRGRYPLSQLADASGYTTSGARTAYTGKEVHLVQDQIGRAPRRPVTGEDQS